MDPIVIPGRKKKNWFPVKVEGSSKVFFLPPLEKIDFDTVMRMRSLAPKFADPKTGKVKKDPAQKDVMKATEILVSVIQKHAPGLMELLDSEQMDFLMSQWSEFSQVSVGESSASPN